MRRKRCQYQHAREETGFALWKLRPDELRETKAALPLTGAVTRRRPRPLDRFGPSTRGCTGKRSVAASGCSKTNSAFQSRRRSEAKQPGHRLGRSQNGSHLGTGSALRLTPRRRRSRAPRPTPPPGAPRPGSASLRPGDPEAPQSPPRGPSPRPPESCRAWRPPSSPQAVSMALSAPLRGSRASSPRRRVSCEMSRPGVPSRDGSNHPRLRASAPVPARLPAGS